MSSVPALAASLLLHLARSSLFAEPPAERIERLLSGLRCGSAIRDEMRAWGARPQEALFDPTGPAGETAARMPASAFGVWVRLTVHPEESVQAERITAARIEARWFEPGESGCQVRSETILGEGSAPGAWTDEELAGRIAAEQAGALVLWSPHMPLSVDAVEALGRIAREENLALIAVLDPAADRGYAGRVAAERNLPEAALRPLGGIELAFRGMTIHAPSVQLFAEGHLIGPVRPGYRDEEAYREMLRRIR